MIALLAPAAAGLTHLAVASARSTLTALSAPPALAALSAPPTVVALSAPPTTQASGTSGQGPEWGEAAPVGLLIILLMGAALFLLIKSMNRNLRKVPASFEPSVPVDRVGPADHATAEGSAGAATPQESSSESDHEPDVAAPAKPFQAEPEAGDDRAGDGSDDGSGAGAGGGAGDGPGEIDIAAADPPPGSLSAPDADPDGTATIQRRGSPRS